MKKTTTLPYRGWRLFIKVTFVHARNFAMNFYNFENSAEHCVLASNQIQTSEENRSDVDR